MHLGNSIICPVTGIPMIVLAGIMAYISYKKAKKDIKKENITLISSLTMLVFAMQMINFSIPQTGSSGHIIGAVLLSAILGPYIGYIAMCIILLIQAIFFADGGLLALGCNIFNMAFLTCFIVYPYIYKPLADKNKLIPAAIISSIAALQLGSLAVVIEAKLSGSISNNISYFLSLMQTIHLPIGIIEGIFTALVILLIKKYELSSKLNYIFYSISIVLASIISQYASNKPDGLEWSLLKISDSFMELTQGIIFSFSTYLQEKLAVLININSILANTIGIFIIMIIMLIIKKTICYEVIRKDEK